METITSFFFSVCFCPPPIRTSPRSFVRPIWLNGTDLLFQLLVLPKRLLRSGSSWRLHCLSQWECRWFCWRTVIDTPLLQFPHQLLLLLLYSSFFNQYAIMFLSCFPKLFFSGLDWRLPGGLYLCAYSLRILIYLNTRKEEESASSSPSL